MNARDSEKLSGVLEECGFVFEKFNDIAELDQVEFYKMVEIPRT